MKQWMVIAAAGLILASCGSDDDNTQERCQTLECMNANNVNNANNANNSNNANNVNNSNNANNVNNANNMADAGDDTGDTPTLMATESHEADILYGWVAAGQPSEARVREVVETGATIISLRLETEDPFDEEGLIDSLGGEFIRYPTSSPDYDQVAFREAMYDLYDQQLDAGKIVYLHCASSNRVGASWALYQAERKGVPAEDAIEMGRQAGMGGLETRVREVLGL